MNRTTVFIVLFTFVSVLFLGGCASGSAGTVRYSSIFGPKYSVSIINNTAVLLDIEFNGSLYCKDLSPGETYLLEIYSFRDGDGATLVAKGHRDGLYIGMDTMRVRLRSGSRGARKSEVWEVSRLSVVSTRY